MVGRREKERGSERDRGGENHTERRRRESDREGRETTRFDTLAYIIVGKKRALRRKKP